MAGGARGERAVMDSIILSNETFRRKAVVFCYAQINLITRVSH